MNEKMKKITGTGIMLAVVFLWSGIAVSQDITWAYDIVGDWADPNNWDPNTRIPDLLDFAAVQQGEAQISSDVGTIRQLRAGGGDISVFPGGSLHMNVGSHIGRDWGDTVMNVSGGTITSTPGNRLYVGWGGDKAVINQTGGTFSGGRYLIGSRGGGQWNISGGVIDSPSPLEIGGPNAVVEFNISGDAEVSTAQHFYVGNQDNTRAVINQSGGTVEINQELGLGMGTGGAAAIGEYNISSGTLSVGGVNFGYRSDNTGIMNQTGGSVTFNSWVAFPRNVTDGQPVQGARSYYTISGGSLRVEGNWNTQTNLGTGGVFTVRGSGAESIEVARFYFNKPNYDLVFELDENGVTPISASAGDPDDSAWVDLKGGNIVINTLPGFYAEVGDTFDVLHAPNLNGPGVSMDSTTRIDNLSPYFKFEAFRVFTDKPDPENPGETISHPITLRIEVVEVNLPDCDAIVGAGLQNRADLNGDCVVNFEDFAIFAEEWLTSSEDLLTD